MKHLNQSGTWPSGNPRVYFRPKGQKGKPLPDLPVNHPDWLEAYNALLRAHDGSKPSPAVRHQTGTVGAACRAYLASDAFLSLAKSTRAVWRRQIESIEQAGGRGLLADLRARHIRQDLAKLPPHPANNRRKVWRSMGAYWFEAGLVEENPAENVAARKTLKTDGHKAWSREDFATFRAFWGRDSMQRVAFEVMYRTCASIGDACRLGPGMVRDGWLTYQRGKSGSDSVVPMIDAPAWFELDDELEKCLTHHPRHMTFIVTRGGAARSEKAAAQWFSAACRKAGLTGLSAHGIRKGRAAVFKENGALPEQRMAILGHESEAQTQHYSKSADLKRIVSGTESSNPEKPGSNFVDFRNENRGTR